MIKGLRPSVCIDSVFESKSFEEACSYARDSDITAIEFWS